MTVVAADEDSGVDMSQMKADNGKKLFLKPPVICNSLCLDISR